MYGNEETVDLEGKGERPTRVWAPDVWHSHDDAGHVTLLYGLWRATPFKLQRALTLCIFSYPNMTADTSTSA